MRADPPEPRGLSASSVRATRRAAAACPAPATTRPQVSVVIPSQNRRDFLLRSIGTALAQTGVDVEVVVVDDGSFLPAAEYVAPDPRVRVLRHDTPQGVSNARNLGIAAASHRWIAFLDDDDIWAPHKLSTQIAAMEASGKRWSHTGMVRLKADLSVIGIEHPDPAYSDYPQILDCNGVASPTAVVIDASLLAEAGGFDPSFSTMADWDLWVRVAMIAPAEVVAEPLMGYVIHDNSMHRQGTRMLLRELRGMKAKYGGEHPVGGPYLWKWIAETHRRTGHLVSSLPLYAMPVLANPRLLWRTRGKIVHSLRRRLARRDPVVAASAPAWLTAAGEPKAPLAIPGAPIAPPPPSGIRL